jgi:hypothetical protein
MLETHQWQEFLSLSVYQLWGPLTFPVCWCSFLKNEGPKAAVLPLTPPRVMVKNVDTEAYGAVVTAHFES